MKENDIIYEEVDSKEVNDALHMLLHCSLKDTEYETQKEQFELINYYIKQLEEENIYWKAQYHLLSRKIDVIPKSKVKEKIEEIKLSLKDDCLALYEFQRLAKIDALAKIDVLEELLREE